MRRDLGAWILIIIGLVLLLNNLGIESSATWHFIILLWPLILVFWGLRLFLDRSPLGHIIIALLEILVVAMIILVILSPTNPNVSNFLNQYFPWISNQLNNPDNSFQ